MKPTLSDRLDNFYASFEETTAAFNKVRSELTKGGLLFRDTGLDDVECIWHTLKVSFAMGFYNFGDKNIHIPAVYPTAMLPWIDDPKRDLVDVIRHEFGHALADRYRKFFRGGIFKEAFGRSYDEKPAEKPLGDGWGDRYVSRYASKASREDFAETFMLYLKHKGNLPRKFAGKPVLERKWNAVAQICAAIANE